ALPWKFELLPEALASHRPKKSALAGAFFCLTEKSRSGQIQFRQRGAVNHRSTLGTRSKLDRSTGAIKGPEQLLLLAKCTDRRQHFLAEQFHAAQPILVAD